MNSVNNGSITVKYYVYPFTVKYSDLPFCLGEESEGLLTQEVHDLVQVADEHGEEESKDLLTERHKGNITL